MKTVAILLALAVLAALPASAKALKVLDPTMIPKEDATLKALSAVIGESKSRQTELGSRIADLQKQIAAIKARVKNPKIEAGEQLSKEDLDAFNLLNAQLRYLQNTLTVEAARQKNLTAVRDIYRASFFAATMMTEYIGDKGELDDDFDDFLRARAKAYGLPASVELLLSLEDYTGDAPPLKKK